MTAEAIEPDWSAAASLDDWHANILVVGSIDTQKNLNLAVLAFAEYRKTFDPFVRLVFVGPVADAEAAKELRAFAHSLGLAGQVLMTDGRDPAQVRALWLTADAVLQPNGEPENATAAEFRVPVVSARLANTPRKLAEALHAAIAQTPPVAAPARPRVPR